MLAQYDVGHDIILTVGYQGNNTHRLMRWDYDGQVQFADQNPQIQSVNYFQNDVDGNYNALLTEVQKRFSHGFQADFQYMFSRALDEASNDYYFDQYPFNAKSAYGPSDYNVPNNFKLWGLWSPAFLQVDGSTRSLTAGRRPPSGTPTPAFRGRHSITSKRSRTGTLAASFSKTAAIATFVLLLISEVRARTTGTTHSSSCSATFRMGPTLTLRRRRCLPRACRRRRASAAIRSADLAIRRWTSRCRNLRPSE